MQEPRPRPPSPGQAVLLLVGRPDSTPAGENDSRHTHRAQGSPPSPAV
ncbi:unnamed protein product [Nyctereutes procyonoides]|uniref:(raccoon dog) hypothetical protein n=1 Tax=Nyctereutes procyonoides TaxID=34880 RepID=A0A811YW44_NYCPR|nr:unnamed protein product [Nyctereutes procyonoides]